MQKVEVMKNSERRIISELMINSHRSDRQLAKVLGISQPTVTRTRQKLEKEGVIKEYTMIPDFRRLGYNLFAVTFVKLKKSLNIEELEKARESAKESIKGTLNYILLERGMGMNYDGVFLSFHKDYASFSYHTEWLKQFDFLEIADIQSFLVDLNDKIHYKPLTLSGLAKHILTLETEQARK